MSKIKYSCKLRNEVMSDLKRCIDYIFITSKPTEDDDKLLFAVLHQINNKIYLKMLNEQTDYTLSLTISEAIALRILYTDYLQDATTSLGNRLHQISNEVHRLYQ